LGQSPKQVLGASTSYCPGGAIATLSFVGALGASQIGNTAIVALSLFVEGVIIAGFMLAHAYQTCSSLFKHFRLDEAKHSRGDLSYEDFLSADEARVPSGKLETVLGFHCRVRHRCGWTLQSQHLQRHSSGTGQPKYSSID
jgi:hypothetical protein